MFNGADPNGTWSLYVTDDTAGDVGQISGGWSLEITAATYDFTGFFQPVDNLPVVNTVKAGQAIPIKFSLGGDQGLDIFASDYPKSEQIACDSGASLDGIDRPLPRGAARLPTTLSRTRTRTCGRQKRRGPTPAASSTSD